MPSAVPPQTSKSESLGTGAQTWVILKTLGDVYVPKVENPCSNLTEMLIIHNSKLLHKIKNL